MKTKAILILMLGLVVFTACQKTEIEKDENTDQPTIVELAEQEVSTEDNFLINGDRIDNTGVYERYVLNQQDRAIIWRPFPSGWGWDCVGCFGMCNVDNPFPFPWPGEPVPFPFPWESIDHSSVGGVINAGAEGLKLQVFPKPGDDMMCAITGDGFFPIARDIPMSAEMCDIMGLPEGTLIQSGIYAANMGESGEYESITLSLLY